MSVAHNILKPQIPVEAGERLATQTRSRTLYQSKIASEFWINLAGKEFRLVGKTVRIGRALDNDIILDHKSVSRYHALITVSNDRVILEDLKSRNGIKVNSIAVKRAELKDNDQVRVGDLYGIFFERSSAQKKKSAHGKTSPSQSTGERVQSRKSALGEFFETIQTKVDSFDFNESFESLKQKRKVLALTGVITLALFYLMTMSSGGRRSSSMVKASMVPTAIADQIADSKVLPKELERCIEHEDLGNYRQAVACLKALPATPERTAILDRVQNSQRDFVEKRYAEGQQAFDNYYYDLAILKFQEVALVADENSDVLTKAQSNIALAEDRRKAR